MPKTVEPELEDLVARVQTLSMPHRLLMAHELLAREKPDVAEAILQTVMDELAYTRLFKRPFPK